MLADLIKLTVEFREETANRIAALDRDRTLTRPVREARKKEAQRSLNKLNELAQKMINERANLDDFLLDGEPETTKKTDTYSEYLRDN